MTTRTALLGVVAALMLVVLFFAVFVMGGSSDEDSQSGGQTTQEQAGSGPSTGQDDQQQSTDGQDQPSDEPEDSSDDQTGEDSDSAGSGDSGSGDSGPPPDGSGGDDGDSYENVEDELSERRGGGVPEGEVAIEDEEGRSNGQRGFVSGFVGAAYGYTGSDPEAYLREAERRVDTATYYDSPGGDVLRETRAVVADGGAESAAVLRAYRILAGPPVKSQVSASEVEGFAGEDLLSGGGISEMSHARVTFALGDRYGDPSKDEDFGQVYGNVNYYSQDLLLRQSSEGGWRIVAGGVPQPTEDPAADRPDPDAPKVMEPQGPGGGGHDH